MFDTASSTFVHHFPRKKQKKEANYTEERPSYEGGTCTGAAKTSGIRQRVAEASPTQSPALQIPLMSQGSAGLHTASAAAAHCRKLPLKWWDIAGGHSTQTLQGLPTSLELQGNEGMSEQTTGMIEGTVTMHNHEYTSVVCHWISLPNFLFAVETCYMESLKHQTACGENQH